MKSLTSGIAAAVLAFGVAQAQTTTAPSTTAPGTAAPGATPGTMSAPMTPAPATGSAARPAVTAPGTTTGNVVNRNTGTAAASGDTNQAVATTNANAPTPARGRNSFSMGEARRRIESRGYSAVSGLAKDNGGVWRGKGTKDGNQVSVWLDYKGNVGQQ